MKRRSTVRLTDKRLSAAFSLVEIMVAVAVLVILTVFVAQLTNSATAITRVGTKHIDADTQARAVLPISITTSSNRPDIMVTVTVTVTVTNLTLGNRVAINSPSLV